MSAPRSLKPPRRSLSVDPAAPLAVPGSAAESGPYREGPGLTLLQHRAHPCIRSVDFRFRAEDVRTFDPSVRITLPEGYDLSRTYPILLLLHGATGSYRDWTDEGDAVESTRGHDLITVMPDAGAGSFYSDAHFSQPGREAAWETFIIDRVLPFVHQNFCSDPGRMAIAGGSMGGFGALALGQKYYGHFRSISAYSGPADAREPAVASATWAGPGGDALEHGESSNRPGAIWGTPHGDLQFQYDPMSNIDKYRGKRLFLRTGDGASPDLIRLVRNAGQRSADVQGHFVHRTMERFHGALDDAGIAHDYALKPGRNQGWGLWNESLAEDLPQMMATLSA